MSLEMLEEKYKRQRNILTICMSCVALIFIYSFVRCYIQVDLLQTKLGIFDFDGWSLTHFVFFYVLTSFYPKDWKMIFALGILWEMIENVFGGWNPENMRNILGFCKKKGDAQTWWYGKISDIFANSVGIALALKTQ